MARSYDWLWMTRSYDVEFSVSSSGSHTSLGKSTTLGSDRNSRKNRATGFLSGASGVPKFTSNTPRLSSQFTISVIFFTLHKLVA